MQAAASAYLTHLFSLAGNSGMSTRKALALARMDFQPIRDGLRHLLDVAGSDWMKMRSTTKVSNVRSQPVKRSVPWQPRASNNLHHTCSGRITSQEKTCEGLKRAHPWCTSAMTPSRNKHFKINPITQLIFFGLFGFVPVGEIRRFRNHHRNAGKRDKHKHEEAAMAKKQRGTRSCLRWPCYLAGTKAIGSRSLCAWTWS